MAQKSNTSRDRRLYITTSIGVNEVPKIDGFYSVLLVNSIQKFYKC